MSTNPCPIRLDWTEEDEREFQREQERLKHETKIVQWEDLPSHDPITDWKHRDYFKEPNGDRVTEI